MKRKRSSHGGGGTRKKARHAVDQSVNATPSATHPVLQRLYPQVFTLRHYLLSRLPSSSTTRRRRISQLGHTNATQDTKPTPDLDSDVAQLLDSVLVGTLVDPGADKPAHVDEQRDQDIEAFTQQKSQCTPGGTFKPGYFMQTEVGCVTQVVFLPRSSTEYIQIVDFVIWRLFKRSASHKPTHLLCHGFQRANKAHHVQDVNHDPTSSIPGLVERHLNSYRTTLKEPAWCRLHALLGHGGDRIIMDMLLECSIFLPIQTSIGNYYQLSGVPISEVRLDQPPKTDAGKSEAAPAALSKSSHLLSENRAPGAITFVRSRMLYAKAALNAKGGVRFGMRHIRELPLHLENYGWLICTTDVLNRFSNRDDKQQTTHIMRYIFPRQFGLHNVFTSKVDSRETAMPFKDYTLREKDIHSSMCRELGNKATNTADIAKWKSRTPKRLKGSVVALVQKLRTLNQRCSYMELLRHYCPVEVCSVTSGNSEFTNAIRAYPCPPSQSG
jgi:telomerase reverse transcriptase